MISPGADHAKERARLSEVFRARKEASDAFERYQREVRFVVFEAMWAGRRPWQELSILEVGCGFGGWLLDFEERAPGRASLTGIDLLDARITVARARLERADLRVGCGSELPFEDGRFDLIVLSTVLSSIASEALAADLGCEIRRVARQPAWCLVFDIMKSSACSAPRPSSLGPVSSYRRSPVKRCALRPRLCAGWNVAVCCIVIAWTSCL
jgi:ubiquinone/menaquinone biosynthesis C-methylase UbiE